eukprot:gene12177-15297_t
MHSQSSHRLGPMSSVDSVPLQSFAGRVYPLLAQEYGFETWDSWKEPDSSGTAYCRKFPIFRKPKNEPGRLQCIAILYSTVDYTPAMQQVITLPGVGTIDFPKIQKNYDKWLKSQPVPLEAIVVALTSSVQGLAIGYMLGSVSAMDPNAANAAPGLAAMQTGGPVQQAINLGTLTGVNAGLSCAIKRMREGKEDVWGAMAASFGSGVAYSLVSGAPNPGQAALTTGFAFAAFNGIFYQIGKKFQADPAEETMYLRGKHLLSTLGLQKYENTLKKGQLTDSTIMLWNDSSLAEVKIPPGPRLLILSHLDQYRSASSVLKPGLPVHMPPMPPSASASQ